MYPASTRSTAFRAAAALLVALPRTAPAAGFQLAEQNASGLRIGGG